MTDILSFLKLNVEWLTSGMVAFLTGVFASLISNVLFSKLKNSGDRRLNISIDKKKVEIKLTGSETKADIEKLISESKNKIS